MFEPFDFDDAEPDQATALRPGLARLSPALASARLRLALPACWRGLMLIEATDYAAVPPRAAWLAADRAGFARVLGPDALAEIDLYEPPFLGHADAARDRMRLALACGEEWEAVEDWRWLARFAWLRHDDQDRIAALAAPLAPRLQGSRWLADAHALRGPQLWRVQLALNAATASLEVTPRSLVVDGLPDTPFG